MAARVVSAARLLRQRLPQLRRVSRRAESAVLHQQPRAASEQRRQQVQLRAALVLQQLAYRRARLQGAACRRARWA